MNIWQRLLQRAGWSFSINIDAEAIPRCVICVAPHTSNWDFVLGEVCIRSVGRTAGFLMKSTWFFFPLGALLRRIGGVAVDRRAHANVTEQVARRLQQSQQMWIAITPEGTRSANPNWHKGCLHIAREAGVPLEDRDVEVQPLIPAALFGVPLEEFYRGLEEMEPVFAEAHRQALRAGCRRRFVAFLEKDPAAPLGYRAGIRVQQVSPEHPAYYLRGTENAILIRSSFHPTPIVIQGPGEGARQAAASLLNDILR